MGHWGKLFWVGELVSENRLVSEGKIIVSGDWLVVSNSRSLIGGSRPLVMGEFLLGWPC